MQRKLNKCHKRLLYFLNGGVRVSFRVFSSQDSDKTQVIGLSRTQHYFLNCVHFLKKQTIKEARLGLAN